MSKFLYIAVCLLLVFSVFGVKKIAELKGENALLESRLQTERENATQNWTVFERIKSDLNSSLNSCYEDYKRLSGAFDSYRAAIAASNKRAGLTKNPAPSSVITSGDSVITSEPSLRLLRSARNDGRSKKQSNPVPTTCAIGGNNAIVDALNAID